MATGTHGLGLSPTATDTRIQPSALDELTSSPHQIVGDIRGILTVRNGRGVRVTVREVRLVYCMRSGPATSRAAVLESLSDGHVTVQ